MAVFFREFDGMRDWGWFIARNPIKRVEDTCGIVAEDEISGKTLAAVVCDTWYDDSVHLHVCVDNKTVARHGFIEAVFNYVFNNPAHKDIKIAYGYIPVNNEKAFKLDKKLGFNHVYTLSGGEGGIGFHIVTMTKEECKFLSEVNHG